ncbi:MAG: histidine phosphatase family protein [Deltaproteobacteria bacterium]|nr:histidine phosphatase family protein [Deltaproteobacteria bacterium]
MTCAGTTKFVLLRHGQTVWNFQKKSMGCTDINFSDEGIRKAVQVL